MISREVQDWFLLFRGTNWHGEDRLFHQSDAEILVSFSDGSTRASYPGSEIVKTVAKVNRKSHL